MAQIKDLTKEQLWALRQEIILNSLFTNDYCNSFDIDPKECYTFFDGYVEYLYEIAEDDNKRNIHRDVGWVIENYDNAENLYNWFSCIVWED